MRGLQGPPTATGTPPVAVSPPR